AGPAPRRPRPRAARPSCLDSPPRASAGTPPVGPADRRWPTAASLRRPGRPAARDARRRPAPGRGSLACPTGGRYRPDRPRRRGGGGGGGQGQGRGGIPGGRQVGQGRADGPGPVEAAGQKTFSSLHLGAKRGEGLAVLVADEQGGEELVAYVLGVADLGAVGL